MRYDYDKPQRPCEWYIVNPFSLVVTFRYYQPLFMIIKKKTDQSVHTVHIICLINIVVTHEDKNWLYYHFMSQSYFDKRYV